MTALNASPSPAASIEWHGALALLLIGRDGSIIDAIGDAPTLTGLSADELVGRPADEVIHSTGVPSTVPMPSVAAPIHVDGHLIETWLGRASHRGEVDQVLVLHELQPAARGRAAGRLVITDALLLDQLPGATWTTDHELRITSVLGQVERNIGLRPEQIVGMNITDITETRDPTDLAIANHRAALAGQRTAYRYRLRDRWYDVTLGPLCDGKEQIVGCIGCAVDVTARVKAEQRAAAHEAELVRSLRRTISLLEATLESTADGILVIDRSGKVAAYNTQFAAQWQIPAKVLARRDDAALLAFVLDQLADPAEFMQRVRSLYEHPRAESLELIVFKNGKVFERYSRPQYVGDDIVGRVWSFRDVTERERVARRLRLLSEASRLLTTLDLAASLDAVARLVVDNMAETCVIGVSLDRQVRHVAAATRRSEPLTESIAFPVTERSTVVHEVEGHVDATVPVLSAGALVGAIRVTGPTSPSLVRQDVEVIEELALRCATAVEGERLYRQRADEVRAREEFLGVAAHEFRSPLTVISLAAAALREGIGDKETLIGEIEREGGRMALLVQELLDAAKLRNGELSIELEPVDLVDVTRAAVREQAHDIERSGSRIDIEAPSELLGQWDRVRIHQVIANILSNAIKYGDGKPIEIALRAAAHEATFTVTDHGIGIPAHELATLFEPFARATPARRYGGLGLGLFIVQRIVESLGGRIEVQSRVGEGSTFTVTLPREGEP